MRKTIIILAVAILNMRIPGEARSPIPVISVHSVGDCHFFALTR